MKIILCIALLFVVTHAEELKPNQVQIQENTAADLIHVLSFETEAFVNDANRDKRQFG